MEALQANTTGQPMVDEAVLSTVKDIPQAALIAEYLMLQKTCSTGAVMGR